MWHNTKQRWVQRWSDTNLTQSPRGRVHLMIDQLVHQKACLEVVCVIFVKVSLDYRVGGAPCSCLVDIFMERFKCAIPKQLTGIGTDIARAPSAKRSDGFIRNWFHNAVCDSCHKF